MIKNVEFSMEFHHIECDCFLPETKKNERPAHTEFEVVNSSALHYTTMNTPQIGGISWPLIFHANNFPNGRSLLYLSLSVCVCCN